MKNRYQDLVNQTFDFPSEEFALENGQLHFHGVPLQDVIEKYGSPLKLTYLPRIGQKIAQAQNWFQEAMSDLNYQGDYTYCYCTKSNHFSFVVEEALKQGAQLETSSAYDLEIVKRLHQKGALTKEHLIVCNGFKRSQYTDLICELIHDDFTNLIPVLDNLAEVELYKNQLQKKTKIGIRIAAEEEPNFAFYTSRLGIRYKEIVTFYENAIQGAQHLELKMLHFFINTGIKDTAYYWSELQKCLDVYVALKKVCPTVDTLNIGGGFPIKNSLNFDYDYAYMVQEIVRTIQSTCSRHQVPTPNIITEFGSFTVGESSAVIYSVLDVKRQNDREAWYMIDSSFMTTLPDSWALGQRFLLLPINGWENDYRRVNLGGLTCDSLDFYNSEAHQNQIFLPEKKQDEPLYLGFFHTGAYQESLGGYGGLQHCLIPAPKHLLIDRNAAGFFEYREFAGEQTAENMLQTLGY